MFWKHRTGGSASTYTNEVYNPYIYIYINSLIPYEPPISRAAAGAAEDASAAACGGPGADIGSLITAFG